MMVKPYWLSILSVSEMPFELRKSRLYPDMTKKLSTGLLNDKQTLNTKPKGKNGDQAQNAVNGNTNITANKLTL